MRLNGQGRVVGAHTSCGALHLCKVGQNHIYTVYVRYIWQGNHQIYGHIRCIYTVLANPILDWRPFYCKPVYRTNNISRRKNIVFGGAASSHPLKYINS